MTLSLRLRMGTGGSGGSFAPPSLSIPNQGQGLPGTFVKYGSNPVFQKGAGGSWDSEGVYGQSVFYDTRLGCFVMAYSATDDAGGTPYFQTGLAYSDDLISWTKEATNPVFDPGYGQVVPSIVQLAADSYVMYYQTWPASSRVYCATSSDLLSWTVQNDGDPVLDIRPGLWDETVTFDPHARIMDDGETVQVFYAGQDHFGSRAVGYGLTTDLVTFTDRTFIAYWDAANEIAANWGAPCVVASGDDDWGLFVDASVSDGYRWIDRLWTDDGGSTITRELKALQKSTGQWDSAQVFDSAAIWWSGTLYLLYCGSTVAGPAAALAPSIGLATLAWI